MDDKEQYLRAMALVDAVERDPRIFSAETRATVEVVRAIERYLGSHVAALTRENGEVQVQRDRLRDVIGICLAAMERHDEAADENQRLGGVHCPAFTAERELALRALKEREP